MNANLALIGVGELAVFLLATLIAAAFGTFIHRLLKNRETPTADELAEPHAHAHH